MFIRVHKLKRNTTFSFSPDGEMIINTSQITKILRYGSFTTFMEKEHYKKYEKIFDIESKNLSILEIELSTGKTFFIVGPTKAYENVKNTINILT